MDLLENQVSDLRSFLGAAAAPQGPDVVEGGIPGVSPHAAAAYSPDPLQARSHQSSISAPGDNSAAQHHPQSPASSNALAKRRAEDEDDGPAKQQRSKRNRYISIACNECKRRKIKCNGQTPCQRCGHLNLQCLYAPNCCANFKDSDEFRQMADQVSQLQEQVDTLFTSINSLRQETARLAPLQDRVLPPPSTAGTPPASSTSSGRQRPALPFRVPSVFNGPTSIAFTVDAAKNTLHRMGYSGETDGREDGGTQPDPTPHASPLLAPVPSDSLAQGPADPIWEFDEAEMMRLLEVYREEVDVMYPVASVGPVMEHIKYIATWMETARRTGVVPAPGLEQVISDPKTLLLKSFMCCALTVTAHGNSAKAVRLYDSIQPIVDKMLMSDPADVTKLSFLALCAGYRYLSNDEILAWRLIGQVARLCFELGLHRREGLEKVADPQTRRDALHTFWSAYVLDRRWSFSTGLPFVCHDDKIDPKLPYPDGYPFIVAMIGYAKLGAKIWRLVDSFEPAVIWELKLHNFEVLDRDIMEWYESVPEEIRSGPLDVDKMPVPSGPYDVQRARIWTRLRLNQVRIWLYTPVLHSATSIIEHAQLARKAVDLAKQTIRLLAHLNNETDLYRRIQVFYHQFLTSSIAVLFLASTHAPLQFSALCRDEFYMALDLVKEMSSRSWVSHRLWRTIRSLRAYAPKLGLEQFSTGMAHGTLFARDGSRSSDHSPVPMASFNTAAASRSGSRGPAVASPPTLTPGAQPMQLDEPESNGQRLQSEMSRIYEGYTGMTGVVGGVGAMGSPAAVADMGYGGAGLSPAGHAGQGDGGVYQHMKDMF
ncbi:protein STB5 [Chaetomidium leptoderma]|uniref:Protein STB5 n=1 Tax=Chaetomidium leptoderma TaxID=669021 RepID=A0AAN6VPW7_9PEZI|nr:protein STB5 [Chaetomidium leptoderma]